MRTFITSDLHFGHQNIIKYTNRPFSSVEEMNEKLIENWNKVVQPQDEVYVLGDFSFGDLEATKSVFNKLAGNKLLILGNHDDIKIHSKLSWGFVKPYHEMKKNNHYYILNHYPMRSWNKSIHGSRHFFGHSHGTSIPWGWSFDVGIDCWDYTPLSLEQAEETISKLPKWNSVFDCSIMPKGQIWNGRTFDYSFKEFFVGDNFEHEVEENDFIH